jgi:hypothetical protein
MQAQGYKGQRGGGGTLRDQGTIGGRKSAGDAGYHPLAREGNPERSKRAYGGSEGDQSDWKMTDSRHSNGPET